MPLIQLQRPAKPGTNAVRQRLRSALGGNAVRHRENVADTVREFVVGEQPAEDQRQRHDADLRDVRSLIEFRQGG